MAGWRDKLLLKLVVDVGVTKIVMGGGESADSLLVNYLEGRAGGMCD